MANNPKYDQQVASISNPVASNAGELMVQAGRTEGAALAEAGRAEGMTIEIAGKTVASNTEALARGSNIATEVQGKAQATAIEAKGKAAGEGAQLRGKADAIEQNAETAMLSFLGTQAIAATKGKLSADLSNEIKDTIDKLEGFGEGAKVAESNLAYLQSDAFALDAANTFASLAEQDQVSGNKPALVENFQRDIERYKEAQAQNILSKEEVITRITAAVKKYSAMMPGWASEFRKEAADATGIDRIDSYGVHQALTQESARAKLAAQRQAAQLELDKDIAKTYGVPLDKVDGPLRVAHAQNTAQDIAAKHAERDAKLKGLAQADTDQFYNQKVVGPLVASAIGSISAKIEALGAMNADPTKAVESDAYGTKLVSELSSVSSMLQQRVMQLTTGVGLDGNPREKGTLPMSTAEASKAADDIAKRFNGLIEMVKTQDGRNTFYQMVKSKKGQVDLLFDTFMAANPHVLVLNKTGVLPPMFAAWQALGDPETFKSRFGVDLSNAMKAISTMPEVHANATGAALSGNPVPMDALKQLSPNLTSVVASDILTSAGQLIDKTNRSDVQTRSMVNALSSFGNVVFTSGSNKVNVDAAHTLVSKQNFPQAMASLSPDERNAALAPLAEKLQYAQQPMFDRVKALLEIFNDPSKNTLAMQGARAELVPDKLLGGYKIDIVQPTIERQQFSNNDPTKPATYSLGGLERLVGGRFNTTVGTNNPGLADAQDVLNTLNKNILTFVKVSNFISNDKPITAKDVRAAAVPKNTESATRSTSVPSTAPETNPSADRIQKLRVDRVKILEEELQIEKQSAASLHGPNALEQNKKNIEYLMKELERAKKDAGQ